MTNTTANEIQFGVEFETTLPDSDRTPIGPYHRGTQVDWLPRGWKAERDGSIQMHARNRHGCEFVSPKLRGHDGLTEVCGALEKINEHGARVNRSCGLHVTIEFNASSAALARLISLVGNHEKALFAITGTHSRETGRYCKSMKNYDGVSPARIYCSRDRFHVLNLTNLSNYDASKRRIEFRVFAGTLNKEKVVGYVQICLGLVQMALNGRRSVQWDEIGDNAFGCRPGTAAARVADCLSYVAKSMKQLVDESGTGITQYNLMKKLVEKGLVEKTADKKFRLANASGAGEVETKRLFKRLGWNSQYAKTGILKDAIGYTFDMHAAKSKMLEMACRYDSSIVSTF